MPNNRWHYGHFFTRYWNFLPPWFTPGGSTLCMFGNIHGPGEQQDYQGSSFFHPRVFETAIADYLNSYYGFHKSYRKPHYRGPLNWRVLPLSDTIHAACFDIHDIHLSRECPRLIRLILIPIAHDRFIEIKFHFFGTPISSDKIDTRPMFELMDAVIDTFSLEVGEHTLAQWQQVQAQCPDMSLTKDFAELQWPIKSEEVGKAQASPETESPSESLPPKQSQTLLGNK